MKETEEEFRIARKITNPPLLNLLFHVFTTCSNRFTQAKPEVPNKKKTKNERGLSFWF